MIEDLLIKLVEGIKKERKEHHDYIDDDRNRGDKFREARREVDQIILECEAYINKFSEHARMTEEISRERKLEILNSFNTIFGDFDEKPE